MSALVGRLESEWCGKRVVVRDTDGKMRQGVVMTVWHARGHAQVLLDDDGSGNIELARVEIQHLTEAQAET